MRFRNTLLLAAAFVLLAAYIYFFELQGGKGETQKLLNFKVEDVERVTLVYPQQEIRLQKEPSGRWKIIHPVQAAADESTIASIFSALNTSEIKRTIEEKPSLEDLKTFGLENPEVKVFVTLKKAEALPPILVGAKTPLGDSAYVKRGVDPAVLLTTVLLRSSLEKKLYDFRDKKIIELKDDAVNQIALKGSKGDIALTKRGEDWFIDKPKPLRADPAEIKGMLSMIRNMLAQDFLEESASDLKKYGMDRPRLQLTLTLEGQEGQRKILFGNKREGKDEVYLVLDSKTTVYTVDESVFKELDKDLNALRDKKL